MPERSVAMRSLEYTGLPSGSGVSAPLLPALTWVAAETNVPMPGAGADTADAVSIHPAETTVAAASNVSRRTAFVPPNDETCEPLFYTPTKDLREIDVV